jgi:hypothetical protein
MRHYYAGHSYMGINFTYDSPCWLLHVFFTKKERDKWVWEHRYDDQSNLVADVVKKDDAEKIAGEKAIRAIRQDRNWGAIERDYRVIMHYHKDW